MQIQPTNNIKLPIRFYLKSNTPNVAKKLLGKLLKTSIDGVESSGIIIETEAYCGETDKACHAYNGKRTQRTKTMFMSGGIAYIYLCYGMHHLFNVVTNVENKPHAVLIRGIIVCSGHNIISERTGKSIKQGNLLDGPGKLTKALGITTFFDKESLLGDKIWIEDIGLKISQQSIITTKRIGIDYADEDALLPYRFLLDDRMMKSISNYAKIILNK